MIETRANEQTYTGTDAEIDDALAETFPRLRLTKRCDDHSAGVIVRNEWSLMDGGYSLPKSLTVMCAECREPFYSEVVQ